MEHEVHIEVRDKDMIGSEMIGHCRVPVRFFAKVGGAAEWLELKWQGFDAGTIHFRSEYFPQAVVEPVMAPPVMAPREEVVVAPAGGAGVR